MWKLRFLVAAWLVHAPVLCNSDFPSIQHDLKTEMESIYDKIADEMLISLSKAHSWTLQRRRREISSDSKLPLVDDTGVYRLQSIIPVSKLCSPAVYSTFLDIENSTYAICISQATIYSPAEVTVVVYKDHNWTLHSNWIMDKPTAVSAFFDKKNLYILVADRKKAEGTDLMKINLATKTKVVDHIVNSKYVTSVAIWEMKIDGKHHMALANSAGLQDSADFSSEIFIYEWMGTYFDKYSSILAYDVKDIEPFHIHGAAYLAVANFRRDKNNAPVDSEIFKYDLDKSGWVSHQTIRTYGAMDWEFFTMGKKTGQEFFLAVANRDGASDVKSVIYKFVKDKFVPFQCLSTVKATSIAALNANPIFLLAVASAADAVQFYQYDGWRFVRTSVQLTQGSMSSGVNHLIFHNVMRYLEEVSVLSVSNPFQPNEQSVYEIGFKHENSQKDWYDESSKWCIKTLEDIEASSIDSAIGNLDDVLLTNQSSITINGNVIFEKGFEAKIVKTPKFEQTITDEVYDSHLLSRLQQLQQKLSSVEEKLKEFEIILNKALKLEGNQTVESTLEFKDALFDCKKKTCHFKNIITDILNGEEVVNWENQLVFLDTDQYINGTLSVDEIKADAINVLGLVDGIESSNLVTKSGSHVITGHKTFEGLVTVKDLEVKGLVDGIKISPTNVFLTTGHQVITGNLTFENIDASWLEVDHVNGINLSKFYDDIVFTNKPSIVTGKKTFQDISVGELTMSPGSTVNGVDLADLWSNALWKDGDQEIKAPMNFSSITLANNLISPSGINGIMIPGPRVVNIRNPAKITAPHTFSNSTKIAKLVVLDFLNGMATIQTKGKLPQLDILLKSGEQVITGKKTFQTIHLDADSYVAGTVDGVDLSEFKKNVLRKETVPSNATWIFNNMVVKGPLTVKGKVSGYDLDDIYNRALKLSDKEIPEIRFKNTVYIEELESRDINNIDVKRDLVLANEPQVITGRKIFRDIILEENSFILGTVNNINMNFLNETVIRIGNQRIKSKVFSGNVEIKELTVTGSINGVPVEDFVTISGPEAILGNRELINVSFNEIEASNLEVTGKVNNIDVEKMIEDTMTYNGAQVVTGTKSVKGMINIASGANLNTDDLNGINFSELLEDAVLMNISQEILGVKTFTGEVSFSDLVFHDTIDGVSAWDMKHNWMLKNSSQVVEGETFFQKGLSAQNIEVGLINDIDIRKLNSSVVKINEPTTVEGPITFENILSNGNITLSGKVQNIKLSEEVVTKSGPIVVKGEKTFVQDLVIEGDATVDGLVDNVKIEDLCKNTLLVNKEQNITRITIKGNVTLLDSGIVDGNIAGVNLKQLQELVVINNSSEILIEGKKHFKKLTIDGPVQLGGKFGDVDLSELNQTYMSLTRDQNIFAPMEFKDISFNGTLSAKNLDTKDKTINGIDIENLNSRILKKVGAQTVNTTYNFDEVIFAGDVFVAGKVNGLEVPNGLMRRNRTNYIQSSKIFQRPVHVLGDLKMDDGKLIQGVDVSEWGKKAVLKDGGKFEIDGYKIFHKPKFNNMRVEGLLDGLKISEETLLMTYGDQVVTGQKTVTGNVEIKGSLTVDGTINGVDLDVLSKNTLQRDRNNTVTGLKYFKQPLTIHTLQAPTVAGVDIVELQRKVNTSLNYTVLQNRLEELERVAENMQLAFDNQAVLFLYYELLQEFSIPTAYSWLYVAGSDCGELLLLSDNSSSLATCSSIRLFTYSKGKKKFIPIQQELLASYASSVKSLFIQNSTFLFIANQIPNKACSGKYLDGHDVTTSDIYKYNGKEFELFQTLPMKETVDMIAFKDGDLACLVYLELLDAKVYCSRGSGEFSYKETLPTKGGRKASSINAGGQIILAIVAEDVLNPRQKYTDEQKVDIYFWNSKMSTFFNPVQVIKTTYAQSVILMNHRDKYSEKMFLVIAEGSIPKIHNEPKILIYRYEVGRLLPFYKYQEINDYGSLEWISLQTGELILFALDSRKGQVKLYQYKGASGFVNIDSVTSIGTVSVHAFIRQDPKDNINHYLALAGPKSLMAQPTQGLDYVKILKSKVIGSRPLPDV